MILRFAAVFWILALLAGFTVYFSEGIFSLFHELLDMTAGQWMNVLELSEVGAKLLAILGTLALCLKLVIEFVLSSRR